MKMLIAVMVGVATAACTPTELSTTARDPGRATAATAPLPELGAPLCPSFDPLAPKQAEAPIPSVMKLVPKKPPAEVQP